MQLVWYQNFRRDLQIVSSTVSQQSSTTIPAAMRNNASISGDLLSGAKYKFSQNELSLKL